jgi:hypothetical protein
VKDDESNLSHGTIHTKGKPTMQAWMRAGSYQRTKSYHFRPKGSFMNQDSYAVNRMEQISKQKSQIAFQRN